MADGSRAVLDSGIVYIYGDLWNSAQQLGVDHHKDGKQQWAQDGTLGHSSMNIVPV